MPAVDVREMVTDWMSAGLARGKPYILDWYTAHGPQMALHDETWELVQCLLNEAVQKNLFPLKTCGEMSRGNFEAICNQNT